ncbi:hypothetical protein GCG54_00009741 [Colletotrichum gloeosporioides]|uniref:Uncharacterized protein n=1 Tax=Colletotrichum gloeosporioides TaxID=474922 RepID=A0A8H4FI84_COLGL|nr:uncharacterized protein GCG54_00009741 [Colletotrichum gloeosporioides]KAF3803045.1 hypothetical protein GCG54_00009741 [Colletotrichum gloeosporioides]
MDDEAAAGPSSEMSRGSSAAAELRRDRNSVMKVISHCVDFHGPKFCGYANHVALLAILAADGRWVWQSRSVAVRQLFLCQPTTVWPFLVYQKKSDMMTGMQYLPEKKAGMRRGETQVRLLQAARVPVRLCGAARDEVSSLPAYLSSDSDSINDCMSVPGSPLSIPANFFTGVI